MRIVAGDVLPPPRKIPKGAIRESEADWARKVADWAKQNGWRRHHHWLSVRSTPGWPDEALVRPPRLVIAELKAEDGIYTKGQPEWLSDLAACPGIEVYVWRPSDLVEMTDVLARDGVRVHPMPTRRWQP